MLLKLYKSNFSILLVVLFFIGALLWINAFLNPVVCNVAPSQPLFGLLYSAIETIPVLIPVIAYILVFLQALLFNNLVSKFSVLSKKTYLPALIYVLLMSAFTDCMTLQPVSISILILLLMFNKLLLFLQRVRTNETLFSSGFLVACASFFYFPAVFFYVLLPITCFIVRDFNWRTWIISLAGIFTPFLWLFSILYLNDQLQVYGMAYTGELLWIDHTSFFDINVFTVCFLIVITLLILRSYSFFLAHFIENVKVVRQMLNVFNWGFLIALASVVLSGSLVKYHIMLFLLPAALFLSKYLLEMKKQLFAQLILYLLIVMTIIEKIL